jgi:hypothetical protein
MTGWIYCSNLTRLRSPESRGSAGATRVASWSPVNRPGEIGDCTPASAGAWPPPKAVEAEPSLRIRVRL